MSGGSIIDRFRASENLPSLPSVALQVLSLTEQPDCTIEQLAGVIQNDPALTARILKVINSPLFGIAKNITSIKQSSTLLGMRKLRIMALSFSIVHSIAPREDRTHFNYERYWRLSLTAAVASRLLAMQTAKQLTEDAFVAGLLHNIGLVAGHLTAPDLFAPLLERQASTGWWTVEDEIKALGVSHAELSAELLDVWGLPQSLTDAVRFYREADDRRTGPAEVSALSRLLCAGVAIADLFTGDAALPDIERCRTTCIRLIGIRGESLEQVLDVVATRVQEIASMLSLNIGETISYDRIVARAKEQLRDAISSAEPDEAPKAKKRGRAA